MTDPYHLLGVPKSATADEIKSAYRKLAKKLHPDVNPGRKDIEQKFKEVTSAYDILSDKDKRARFDRGEIDAQGQERGFGGGNYGGGQYRRGNNRTGGDPFGGFAGMEGMEDIFAEFMSGGRKKRDGASQQQQQQRGTDVTYSLAVPFVEATMGGKQRVTLSSGKTIDITIPPATEEGHKLRLRGQGQEGPGGTGDAIIEIHIEPHAFFTRKDRDVTIEAPVSLPEAVLGATIKVPTLNGSVAVKVPKGANTGTMLRLKGKGVPAAPGTANAEPGDMFVKLKIMLPDPPPDDLTDLIEKWSKKNAYDPRKKLGW